MNVERHILTDELEDGILRKIIIEKLPKNAMILNDKMELVKQYKSFCSIETELNYLDTVIAKLADIRINDNQDQNTDTFDHQYLIKKSLFIAAVISYARCFNSTFKDGRISLKEKFIKKGFPEHPSLSVANTMKFHKKIMELRNSFVAHADKSEYEETVAFIEFSYQNERMNAQFSHITNHIYSFDETEIQNFIVLTAYLLKKTKEKIKQLSDKIADDITEKGLLYLGRKTINEQLENDSNGITNTP